MKNYHIITGANNGIGLALTKKFLSEGHSVVAISRGDSNLQKLSGDLKVLKLNILDDLSELEDLFENTSNKVESLVNMAGQLINKSFDQTSIEDFRRLLEVNFIGPVRLIKSCKGYMVEDAHIVNIGTMGAFQGSSKFPGLSAYSSSKAALMNLSELLAEEFKNENIKVNGLALGAVQTDMLQKAFPGYKTDMDVEKMAEFIYDFTLNGKKYFNGKILPVSNSTP